ncbi:unnamed protein product [Gongylonema pulchrum]|uniref:Low-density lipoprotein receptor domain class A n=1 Tax=Gongylonema pulchrum TaxID=637853 RepID=A0A183DXP8_9BILA|nr:unnamed protein product [Gongylonema pulchrum]
MNNGISEYPGHVGGRCIASFDCDPAGFQACVPLSAVRDCFADCPNAADEECPADSVLCDTKLQRGCGKCVKPKDRELQCSDRRWRNVCLEPNHFQCATTENCILPQWIADGVDDCADGSDEGHFLCVSTSLMKCYN